MMDSPPTIIYPPDHEIQGLGKQTMPRSASMGGFRAWLKELKIDCEKGFGEVRIEWRENFGYTEVLVYKGPMKCKQGNEPKTTMPMTDTEKRLREIGWGPKQ